MLFEIVGVEEEGGLMVLLKQLTIMQWAVSAEWIKTKKRVDNCEKCINICTSIVKHARNVYICVQSVH